MQCGQRFELGNVSSLALPPILTVCLSFGALFVSPGASAADISTRIVSLKDSPVPIEAPIWQGFYLGGHIGGAWENIDVTDTFTYHGDPTVKNNFSADGVIGGGQIGYNLQRGHLVYGVEVDAGWLDLSGSKTAGLSRELNAKYSTSGGFYGDFTGRLGYATNRALIYAKGGAAFLNADFEANYVGANCTTTGTCNGAPNPSTFNFSDGETLWGWTIGAGAEYALTTALSFKFEYQHFDFGSMGFDHNGVYYFSPNVHGQQNYHSTLRGNVETPITADAVTVGVNYHLNRDIGYLK